MLYLLCPVDRQMIIAQHIEINGSNRVVVLVATIQNSFRSQKFILIIMYSTACVVRTPLHADLRKMQKNCGFLFVKIPSTRIEIIIPFVVNDCHTCIFAYFDRKHKHLFSNFLTNAEVIINSHINAGVVVIPACVRVSVRRSLPACTLLYAVTVRRYPQVRKQIRGFSRMFAKVGVLP